MNIIIREKKVLKCIWSITFIITIITYLIVNIINKNSYEVYNSTNYFALITFEIINIIFGIVIFSNSTKRIISILFIVFIIITLCVPIYHNANTYAPTGPGSELMGLAIKERYLNIYGINIINLISHMPVVLKDCLVEF